MSNPDSGCDESFDSSLLLLSVLRFPNLSLISDTIRRIHSDLRLGAEGTLSGFLYRYLRKDDLGVPHSAFVICSFWLVQALARVGEVDQAQKILKQTMTAANSLGLFSEHFLPGTGKQMGNFPQAYSHVGQINAAFAVSPPWLEVL